MIVEEQPLKVYAAEILESSLGNNQNPEKEKVEVEHCVKTHENNYFIDIAVPEYDIAIECKGADINNIRKGVGQATMYEIDGWDSYICIPHEEMTYNVVKMCMQAGVGLLTLPDVDLYENKMLKVQVKKEGWIPTTESGYSRAGANLSIPEILDNLEVNTIDDVIELNNKLRKIDEKVKDVRDRPDEGRWRNTKLRRDILPEYND